MTRYASNIENDGGCPDCDSYECKIDRMNAKMADLEAHLSSKSQECEELKERVLEFSGNLADKIAELSSLRAERDKWRTESITVRAENDWLNGHIKLLKEMYRLIKNENGQLKSDLYHAQSNLELSVKRCEDLEADNADLLDIKNGSGPTALSKALNKIKELEAKNKDLEDRFLKSYQQGYKAGETALNIERNKKRNF